MTDDYMPPKVDMSAWDWDAIRASRYRPPTDAQWAEYVELITATQAVANIQAKQRPYCAGFGPESDCHNNIFMAWCDCAVLAAAALRAHYQVNP